MRRLLLFVLLCAIACYASPAQERSRVVYLSPADASTDLSAVTSDLSSVIPDLIGDPLAPDTVYFHGGTYPLASPIAIKGAKHLVLAACPGEKPVFSGSVALSGWKKVRDAKILRRIPSKAARERLYWTDLAKQGICDLGDPVKDRKRPALFYDGKAQTLARYPDSGFVVSPKALGPTEIPPVENGNSGTVEGIFAYDDPRLDRWAEERDPWAMGYWFYDWTEACRAITEVDPKARTMTVKGGKAFRHGLRFFGFNLLCELDSPGEWYIDRSNSRLYWYAPEGADFSKTSFAVLGAKAMLSLEDCEDVTLDELSFVESRGGALRVTGGREVRILNCRIENMGDAAIKVDGGRRHLIDGCVLRHLETSGVTLRGGDRKSFTRADHLITNTLIEDYERFHRTYNGAFTGTGCGITISHCVLRDGPSSAISLEGNDLVAEYNIIEEVARESDDQGGFDLYLNPSMRGLVLRYNLWRNIRGGTRYGVAGIRLDDLISGVQITGNVFDRCGSIEFGGVQIHGGSENVIEDNLFFDCPYAVSFTPYGDSLWHATWERIRGNISKQVDMFSDEFLLRYPEVREMGRNIDVNIVRNNLLVDCGALYFREAVRQIGANNVSVASDGRTLEDLCDPELLKSFGIKRIPIGEMGIISNKWLNDEQ